MHASVPSRGLIIRQPYAGFVVEGAKTWEMRTSPTKVRGTGAIIASRTGTIIGVADMIDSLPPITSRIMHDTADRHRIAEDYQADAISGGWIHPWVLTHARKLAFQLPYTHASGAVIWVKLDEATRIRLAAALRG